jgi:Reverse transcriptase (RNA-dependent DNA polymerase)
VSATEVHNRLQTTKLNSAVGPDKIPGNVMKNCAASLSQSVAHIFILSLLTGELPPRLEPCEVQSGVIQGSVLGPLLFNVFMARLPEQMKTKTTIIMYADDCLLYITITIRVRMT